MKSRFSTNAISSETIDEASQWFVEFRLGELGSEARERFIEWLRASPSNIRAYIEIAGAYTEMAPPNTHVKLDVEKLIAEARAEPSVVELPLAKSRAPSESSNPSRSRRLNAKAFWGLAASIVLAIAGGFVWHYQFRDIYQTQIGEQRSLTLADGSRVDLNARSKVRIHFGSEERRIELLSGQALFQVARDAKRPFVVHAAGTAVRAIGTAFDVNRGESGTTVTVIEGRVAVSSTATDVSDATSQPIVDSTEILLSAGEQLKVKMSASARPAPTPVDVKAATAWTQHQLMFESTPLQEVIEQFNRYNARQIMIDDRTLESFNVSGYYATSDPTSLLNFLRTEPRIKVLESEESIIITRK